MPSLPPRLEVNDPCPGVPAVSGDGHAELHRGPRDGVSAVIAFWAVDHRRGLWRSLPGRATVRVTEPVAPSVASVVSGSGLLGSQPPEVLQLTV